jgi:hypothetical protein
MVSMPTTPSGVRDGAQIVHPLTEEKWNVWRLCLAGPGGDTCGN